MLHMNNMKDLQKEDLSRAIRLAQFDLFLSTLSPEIHQEIREQFEEFEINRSQNAKKYLGKWVGYANKQFFVASSKEILINKIKKALPGYRWYIGNL